MARLSRESLDRRIMDWLSESPHAADGDNQFFIELVERITSDTWRSGRWYMDFDPVNDVWDCQPREGLHVLMTEEPISDHEWIVRVRSIYFDPDRRRLGAATTTRSSCLRCGQCRNRSQPRPSSTKVLRGGPGAQQSSARVAAGPRTTSDREAGRPSPVTGQTLTAAGLLALSASTLALVGRELRARRPTRHREASQMHDRGSAGRRIADR